MKTTALTALAAVLALSAPAAFAQPDRHDDHKGGGGDRHDFHPHPEWRKGAAINHDDWGRGQPVDYHAHHLRQPPRGYEWREVDGNYVLAAVATGVIASIIANAH